MLGNNKGMRTVYTVMNLQFMETYNYIQYYRQSVKTSAESNDVAVSKYTANQNKTVGYTGTDIRFCMSLRLIVNEVI